MSCAGIVAAAMQSPPVLTELSIDSQIFHKLSLLYSLSMFCTRVFAGNIRMKQDHMLGQRPFRAAVQEDYDL